jgi:feruloyl esterase
VLAGAPGPNMPLQSVRMMWFGLLQKWKPQAALTEADWDLYEKRATAACDAADGRKDGIIENPVLCRFNIESLKCRKGQDGANGSCIPSERLDMLRAIVSPMTDADGNQVDGGLFPGVRTRPGPPSPLLRAMWVDAAHGDPQWDEDKFDRTADLELINRVMPELRADRISIDAFMRTGRKAIIYQGWADPSTNAGPTIDYYRGLVKGNGGLERVTDSVRLFMVPGMYHCGRGPGADNFGASGQLTYPGDPQRDMLWALIRWVEDKQAPESITATKVEQGEERFTHKLCTFPQALQSPAGSKGEGSCMPSSALEAMLTADTPAGVY